MPRAKYIWIIRIQPSRLLVGAWTVKHEMVTWLKRYKLPIDIIQKTWEVTRLRDGQPGSERLVPWEDIL